MEQFGEQIDEKLNFDLFHFATQLKMSTNYEAIFYNLAS